MDRAGPSSIVFFTATRLAIAAVSISRSIREALVHLQSHFGGLFRGDPIFQEDLDGHSCTMTSELLYS